jgi:hypothetical protein
VVVPEREHFDRIDGARTAAIFSEVSMNGEIVNDLVDAISSLPEPEEEGW